MTKTQRDKCNKQLKEAQVTIDYLCLKNNVLHQSKEDFYAAQLQKQLDQLSLLVAKTSKSINNWSQLPPSIKGQTNGKQN